MLEITLAKHAHCYVSEDLQDQANTFLPLPSQDDVLRPLDVLSFALQIAEGMAFLELHQVQNGSDH